MENIITAYKKYLTNYANFNGRSSRSDYWYVVLANVIIGFVLGFIGGLIPILSGLTYLISVIYSLAVFIPSLAIAIRRLHDVNKSGWFYLLMFIPMIGSIIILVFLCMDSVNENNQYGKQI